MWAMKFIIPGIEGMLVGNLTRKYKVTSMGYPISHFWKGKKFYILGSVYLVGEKKAKSSFLKDLKKDKRAVKIDMMNESFGFWLMEQHPANEMFYDPFIIHTKPVIVADNGDYIFELASWDRKKLENIAKKIETKLYNGKLVYLQQKKIENISIVSMLPNLTEKQKRAIELAIENGYYGYPRKINIEQLAKLMKVSYSTYQFHLRNAEKKIMPYLANIS